MLVFTVSWSNWHLDSEAPVEEETKDEYKLIHKSKDCADIDKTLNEGGNDEDGEDEIAKLVVKKAYPKTKKNIQIHPARIFITSTIGIIIANICSIFLQDNIYANETRLIVSMLIVIFLLFYMYGICKSHIEWDTEVELIEENHK